MRHQPYEGISSKRIALTGSSGLVGSHLAPFLEGGGHGIAPVSRPFSDKEGAISWSPAEGRIDADAFEGIEAVVHLAGESIAEGRWNEEKKRRIRDSRVAGTRLLCETLAGLERKPAVLVSASALGYYGDRGDEVLDESSPPGEGFLPDVSREWEEATRPAAEAGIRVVNLRIGMVLSAAGGALKKMLPAFKSGAAGRLGSGKQWMSWIVLDDLIGAIQHALFTEDLAGPVNAGSPNPVTNRTFTKTLGKVLHRPTALPAPATALRLAWGQMADDLLLASTRMVPRRLQETGFSFLYPELEAALRHELGKESQER